MVHAGLAEWASTTGPAQSSAGEREAVDEPRHLKQPLDWPRTGHEKESAVVFSGEANRLIDELDSAGVHEVQPAEVSTTVGVPPSNAAIRAAYSSSLVARSSSPCG